MADPPLSGPLSGLLVADFSRILAGPYASMLLGDLGADVVKVESPGGDDTRTWLPPTRGEVATVPGIDFNVELGDFAEFTLLIAKKDPGAPIVWTAFGLLLVGLVITFYLPRRRVWARQAPDSSLALVGRSDRYVDFEREFGRLLDDLVAARPSP